MGDELSKRSVISGIHNLVFPLCFGPEENYLHFFNQLLC